MLRPKTYPLLCRCIEEGVGRGVERAFKHGGVRRPSEAVLERIRQHVEEAIIHELMESFDVVRDPGDEG